MISLELAHSVILELIYLGVSDFCIAPGGRNAPFVAILEQFIQDEGSLIQVFSHFEERAGAFFALGRAKKKLQPVVFITTSGSAVAECYPAILEAHYQNIPLIIVSADRPLAYRRSGAPQAINQAHIFGEYAQSFDIHSLQTWKETALDKVIFMKPALPVHINVCFDEPLWDDPKLSFQSTLRLSKGDMIKKEAIQPYFQPTILLADLARSEFTQAKVLILVSGLNGVAQVFKDRLCSLLSTLEVPIYLEAVSGLLPQDFQCVVRDLGWFQKKWGRDVERIIRIGGVPAHRYWRDLETQDILVDHFSQHSYSGLARPSKLHPLEAILEFTSEDFQGWGRAHLMDMKYLLAERDIFLSNALRSHPDSEPALMHHLSQLIGAEDHLYLGNSLPIRLWNAFAEYQHRYVFASRGVNGIDGQISTFLGLCTKGNLNWGVFGDLTTLYDLSAPWILSCLLDIAIRIVIVNNKGGQIFRSLYPSSFFLNSHTVCFSSFAQLWKVNYMGINSGNDLQKLNNWDARHGICELLPSDEQNRSFWSLVRP